VVAGWIGGGDKDGREWMRKGRKRSWGREKNEL
jgi:hypothetical protein